MPCPPSPHRPAEEFWRFSVDLYGQPGAAPQLLHWQDRLGANVNLALLCLWAGQRGRTLTTGDLARAAAALAGWHAAVTRPLRELRRRLKTDWLGLARETEPTRQAILNAELAAEQAEQALLLAALAPWQAPAEHPPKALPRSNLAAYLGEAAIAAPASSIAAIWSAE